LAQIYLIDYNKIKKIKTINDLQMLMLLLITIGCLHFNMLYQLVS